MQQQSPRKTTFEEKIVITRKKDKPRYRRGLHGQQTFGCKPCTVESQRYFEFYSEFDGLVFTIFE